ncbi:hypothetical protein V202x_20850 [Gimesia aquarii]|uniref:Uncharacterized protein n=1 Tax=Gimesia aquarii TaxID=2527964 RepID=A0A517WTV5_9PLAN|nr:hypothetical protein V202x_20850 [Gimesia aquarii]
MVLGKRGGDAFRVAIKNSRVRSKPPGDNKCVRHFYLCYVTIQAGAILKKESLEILKQLENEE